MARGWRWRGSAAPPDGRTDAFSPNSVGVATATGRRVRYLAGRSGGGDGGSACARKVRETPDVRRTLYPVSGYGNGFPFGGRAPCTKTGRIRTRRITRLCPGKLTRPYDIYRAVDLFIQKPTLLMTPTCFNEFVFLDKRLFFFSLQTKSKYFLPVTDYQTFKKLDCLASNALKN